VDMWNAEEKQRAKTHVEVYKSVRRFLREDYYPLFPQPLSMRDWDGWQFHDPKSGEGFILAFRADSPDPGADLKFRKLDPNRKYALQDPYHQKQLVVDGRTLMQAGLPVKLEVRGTSLWKYIPR
jgi:hypothetical protein